LETQSGFQQLQEIDTALITLHTTLWCKTKDYPCSTMTNLSSWLHFWIITFF